MIHIALLRAINVGGRSLAMADLRAAVAELGFGDPQTLLQSGNVVFTAGRQSSTSIERAIEQKLQQRFALESDVMVRSAKEWPTIIAGNPFRDEAARDPGHLVVTFLKSVPGAGKFDALRSAISGPETVHGDGRHTYIYYPAGIGPSRLTNVVIERKLGVRATARNWNTVTKLAALATERND
jgi:uncharacterized protein (DUF1697 family)